MIALDAISIVTDEVSKDFVTSAELISGWGIDSVEIRAVRTGRVPRVSVEEKDEILRALAAWRVKITAISPGVCKPQLSKTSLVDALKLMDESMSFAEELGVRTIIAFGFRHGLNRAPEDVPAAVIDILGAVAVKGRASGFDVLIENHSSCYVCSDEHLVSCVETLAATGVMINWDPNNSWRCGGRFSLECPPALLPRVRQVHVKDSTLNHGQKVSVPLGTGQLQWRHILRSLAGAEHPIRLVVETHDKPRVRRTHSDLEALRVLVAQAMGEPERRPDARRSTHGGI